MVRANILQMTETFLWPDKKCHKILDCRLPYKPAYDNTKDECVCSIQSLPPWGTDHLVSYDPVDKFKMLQKSQKFYAWLDFSETRGGQKTTKSATKVIDLHMDRRQLSTTVGAVSQTPYPSYVPPPPIEVTQELLQKSMAVQPQKLATVASVIPHFAEGVITFFLQLQGPIAQTLVINATDTLPCGNIGAQPQPNIILVPQTVKNGTPQVTIPSCLVIAVNIYNPLWITYWIRKPDGSIYALTSDNKVHDIDQLDLGVPAAIAIRTTLVDGSSKRRSTKDSVNVPAKRHQVYQIPCSELCPDPIMEVVHDSSNFCGCVLNEASKSHLLSRAVVEPNAYTATMTAEVCAGITCINNGNQPGIYNPFSRTCWCTAPTYVENNPSADIPAM